MIADLPFSLLGWAQFEELIAALAKDADDLVKVRRYGSSGQKQEGIDVIGFTRTDGRAWAYQCKQTETFTASDLSRVVAEFADGARPFNPVRLVVAVAVPVHRKQVLDKLSEESERHPDFDLVLWDAVELNDLLRERPRIVARFFGPDTARMFCLSGSFSPGASSDDVCPYPGLAPFGPDQAQWFFGRAAVIAGICQRMDRLLTAAGPLIVIGPSGAGKSSLLRAGVMHALGEGRLPVSWPCVLMTPTGRPMQVLAERLGAVADGDSPSRAVLIVDQFEEVFTLCPDEQERGRFIDELARMADCPQASATAAAVVVLCVRADFYGHCLEYEPLRAALRANAVPLGPMSAEELREAIASPAEAVGLQVEAGLPELLLSDAGLTGQAGDQAARLPLIAHALRATWQFREGRFLTVDGYKRTGGIRQAVAATAEREFSLLDAAGQRLVEALFLRLVKVGDGTADVCRPLSRDGLLRDLPDGASTADIIDRFRGARLLTIERDTVTIAHEALLSSWPRLSGWIDGGRDDHLIRQRLDEAAAAWNRDRDASVLYRGKRLTAALAWAGARQADLGASAAGFLAASFRLRRRTRAVLLSAAAAAAALVLAASMASAIAIGEHEAAVRKTDQAAFGQAVSQASRQAPDNPQLAAQLDLAAYALQPSSQAVKASLLATENTPLYSQQPVSAVAVAFSPGSDVFATGGGSVQLWTTAGSGHARRLGGLPAGSAGGQAMAFSRDGSTLATAGNGILRLWNVSDPAHPRPLAATEDRMPGAVQGMAFSPAGDLLAVGGGLSVRGVIQLWDVSDPANPHELGPPIADEDGIADSVAFSPDGRTLAFGDGDGYVRLWDVARSASPMPRGEPLPVDPGTSRIGSLAFSPDSKTLAVGTSADGVQLWNVAVGQPYSLGPPLAGCAGGSGSAAFGQDGLLVAGCGDGSDTGGSVRLWNAAIPSRPTPVTLPQEVSNQVRWLAISPDGRTLISVGSQGTVLSWSLPPVMLADGQVSAIAYSRQAGILASAGSGGYVRLWATGGVRTPLPLGTPLGAPGDIMATLAFSPDGSLLAGGDNSGSVRLWQLADPGRSFVLPASFSAPVSSLAFSPQDGVLAAGDGAGPVQLWDVANPARPRKLGILPGDPADGAALAFSPDGDLLATGDLNGNVHLWRLSRLSSPGSAGPGWEATGVSFGGISSLAFSPHGHLLATGADDGTVQLWNVTDPARPAALGQPLDDAAGSYVTVAFNADGTALAIAGSNDSVQMWDPTGPAAPQPIDPPLTVSASPAATSSPGPLGPAPLALAGATVITGSTDGDTRLWDMNVNDAIKRICGIPGDELTPAQWHRYIPQLPYRTTCPQ